MEFLSRRVRLSSMHKLITTFKGELRGPRFLSAAFCGTEISFKVRLPSSKPPESDECLPWEKREREKEKSLIYLFFFEGSDISTNKRKRIQ